MMHQNHGSRRDEDSPLVNPFSSYPTNMRLRRLSPTNALESVSSFQSLESVTHYQYPTSNFLEFETSSRNEYPVQTIPRDDYDQDDDDDELLSVGLEGLSTASGLLLTHRQSHGSRLKARPTSSVREPTFPHNRNVEMDWEFHESTNAGELTLHRVKRILSLTQVWIAACCVVFLIGTGLMWHSSHGESKPETIIYESKLSSTNAVTNTVEQIILVPLPSNQTSKIILQPRRKTASQGVVKPEKGVLRRALRELREEFDAWIETHEKKYHSHDEKERRFHIWKENHFRTLEKNERHGPCKMTKQPVFGSNMFKDLSLHEFQSLYLTGYKGPRTDQIHSHHESRHMTTAAVLEPKIGALPPIHRHPTVQSRYEKVLQDNNRRLGFSVSHSGSCSWYDVSCWLKLFVKKYGYGVGGTMEPAYDSNAYPSAVDWREMGVVTNVHSQGSCGACWAITAVETIESAYAMSSGKLYDLSESELIICDDTCELCEGGWPQNAYDYVMKHKGLPLEKTMPYDGDYLLELTSAKAGSSSSYNYKAVVENSCPSGDQQSSARYGNIGGYGYSTDRCICYTDGTGCDCDKQNEKLALQNIATYGPATVCLDASLWQDYAGGIISAELGCSSAFLDMNHCVQAVGYAYTDVSSNNGDNDKNSRSRDGSKDSGSREGYWIIRNQWSENWGMNGYAYVAIGGNTCGVLNDMTNVFMK